jgi:predicted MFS family arabinose efflux permease
MLLVPVNLLAIPWVMAAQALSGVAKDLNKMSAKSAIKLLVPASDQGTLYKWVALLTGSKNALKGAGFFLGGAMLTLFGFTGAIATMAVVLALVWIFSLVLLEKDLGKAKNKPPFSAIFSKSRTINFLSAARLFLFGARDVWFVVALPVFLASHLGWDHWSISSFIGFWIIGYGIVQSIAPIITRTQSGKLPDGKTALSWALVLALIPALIALALMNDFNPTGSLMAGLTVFGVLFAINSSLHSYLIVSYANEDGVSLDIGFYYMANAMGRLIGTVLSGWLFQVAGLEACLWVSSAFIAIAALMSLALPKHAPMAA